MKLEFSRHMFVRSLNIKFRQNPSSRSRVISYGRTDGQTDMMKLTAAIRKVSNASKYTVAFSKGEIYCGGDNWSGVPCNLLSKFLPELRQESRILRLSERKPVRPNPQPILNVVCLGAPWPTGHSHRGVCVNLAYVPLYIGLCHIVKCCVC
jgi:hypothetical protein